MKVLESPRGGRRGGGGGGGVSYFSCMGEGTRLSHAKFQVSMSIRCETVVFYKILGLGGGAPFYPFGRKSQTFSFSLSKIHFFDDLTIENDKS